LANGIIKALKKLVVHVHTDYFTWKKIKSFIYMLRKAKVNSKKIYHTTYEVCKIICNKRKKLTFFGRNTGKRGCNGHR